MKQTIVAVAATKTLDNKGVTVRVIKGMATQPRVSIYDMRKEEENGKKGEGLKGQPINLILTDDIPEIFLKPENYPIMVRFEPKDMGVVQGSAVALTVAPADLEVGKIDLSKVVLSPVKKA